MKIKKSDYKEVQSVVLIKDTATDTDEESVEFIMGRQVVSSEIFADMLNHYADELEFQTRMRVSRGEGKSVITNETCVTIRKGSEIGIVTFSETDLSIGELEEITVEIEMNFSENEILGMARCQNEGCDCDALVIDIYRDENSRFRVYGLSDLIFDNDVSGSISHK